MNIPKNFYSEYTSDDESAGEEYRDARRMHRQVREIMGTVSWKTIREFEKTFPCPKPSYRIEVFSIEYIEEQEDIARRIKLGEQEYITEQFTPEIIRFHSMEDFYYRWNRFAQIKAFL